jgi:hypothetical protein
MTGTIVSGVAAVATLAVFAHFSAVDAGSFKRSRAKAAQAGKFKAARRSVQRRHRTARNLSSGRRTQAYPNVRSRRVMFSGGCVSRTGERRIGVIAPLPSSVLPPARATRSPG